MLSTLALFLSACLPQAVATNTPTGSDDWGATFPVFLAESAGVQHSPGPIWGGVPFASGELRDSGKITYGGGTGDSWAMSRWPDGSVRWLGIELNAPTIPANSKQELSVSLSPGHGPPLGSTVNNSSATPENLLSFPGDILSNAIKLNFSTLTAFGPSPTKLIQGDLEIEHQTSESCTVRREDQYQSVDGREVIRFITRATNYRSSNMVHLAHTMEVIRGTHKNPQWSLRFPLNNKSKHYRHIQLSEKAANIDGANQKKTISGLHQEANFTVAATDFWKLFPTGMSRDEKGLEVMFACPSSDQYLTLEAGMGRTHHLWIWLGKDQPNSSQALARANAPVVLFTSPERATSSGAAGPLLPPNSDPRLDEVIQMSVDRVFKFSEQQNHHFGFFDWGDFFVHDGTLSYTGCINQEYDPAMVMHQAFLRTGDPKMLLRALPMARHYADVDIADTGGVFQHRATRHHADAWIAKVMANGFYKSIKNSKGFDGSPEALLKIVKKKNKGIARNLEPHMRRLLESGEPNEVIIQTALEIMGQGIVNNIVGKLGEGDDDMTMKKYCEGIATSEMARDYGFKNASISFKPFFDLYGGSWDNFPTFHVDNSPDPSIRHTGGHSLVESIVFAWWETGDPRFLEVALRVGQHHVDVLVPQELGKLGDGLERKGNPRTRTVGWPLINMARLYEMTEGMDGQEQLHEDLYSRAKECADALIQVPFNRIEGSIHAGVTMEALANWHTISGDEKTAEYLVGLARYWAANVFDKRSKSFRYKAHKQGNAARGFSGLVSYGLAYAQKLKPHTDTWRIFKQTWGEMLKPQKKAKPMAMTLRSAARTVSP